jgi:hypothetical protein
MSSVWNYASFNNYDLVNPPTGKLLPVPSNTYGPSIYSAIQGVTDNLSYINLRAPYAQEVLKTPYGNNETRVGTDIGR